MLELKAKLKQTDVTLLAVSEQNALLTSQVRERLKQTDESLLTVTGQNAQLNNDVASIKLKDRDAATSEVPQFSAALRDLSNLKTRCNDAEGRSRRSNLLFFGLPDKDKETWNQSEGLVVELCFEKLGIRVDPIRIERAHHLGSFNEQKCRPMSFKLSSFKEKESIMSSAYKLKKHAFFYQ